MTDSPGTTLRASVMDDLAANGLVLSPIEAQALTEACATADLIASLQRAIDTEGVTYESASGVVHVHPAVAAVNTARGLLARLLSRIDTDPPAAEELVHSARDDRPVDPRKQRAGFASAAARKRRNVRSA